MEIQEYESRAEGLKRARDETEKASKEVPATKRIEALWEYSEDLKKLQALETELELLRKRISNKERRMPDLKNLRGNVDHISSGKFFDVAVGDNKHRILPGKSYEEAKEKHLKKMEQDQKNAEKQKAAAKQKGKKGDS